jgi:hypothetical protein
MRVELANGGLIADGMLNSVLSEVGASYPHMVIEMRVTGIADLVKVTLDENDLFVIARFAKNSTVQRIRDAVAKTFAQAR